MRFSWLTVLAAGSLMQLQAQGSLVSPLSTDSLFVCDTGVMHHYLNPAAGSDSVVIQYEDPAFPADSEARFPSKTLTAVATESEFIKVLFPQEIDKWTHQVFKSQFDFSTETFGTRYYIELCYRGPEKQTSPGSTQDLSQGIYSLDLSVNLNDPTTNGINYRNQASLATSIETVCDLRASGSSANPRVAEELAVTYLERDSWYASNPTSWNSNSLNFQVTLNNSIQTVPRFCRIRISFNERSTGVRNQALTPRDVNVFAHIDRL